MPTPIKTIHAMDQLCTINSEYQAIDWLRFANKIDSPHGHVWTIKQNDGRIQLHVQNEEALLLLFMDAEPPPPMDNIKPQWDATPMVQAALAQNDAFPQAVAWTPNIHAQEWTSIWLATQWWPTPGTTDAVDEPQEWLRWWWSSIMEFTSLPPDLYDTPIV